MRGICFLGSVGRSPSRFAYGRCCRLPPKEINQNAPTSASVPLVLLFRSSGIFAKEPGTNPAPMAHVNFISVDRNFVPQTDISQTNFVRITEAAKDSGANGGNGLHERLYAEVTVKQAGYMYIYLSNDNPTVTEVYFDDFKVTQIKSPVIASNDYYPFGLTFNSYTRENSVTNQYQYNSKELQDELNIGWMDYGARMYDPAIGRWMVIDPLAGLSRRWSPYTYAYDNSIRFIDPDGMYATEEWKKDNGVTDDDVVNVYTAEPDQEQSEKGNSVGIAAYGEKSKDKNTFEQRKQGFGTDKSYSVHTGNEFINSLVKASESGPITRLIVGSHGSGGALYMNDNAGIYTDTFDKVTNTWFSSKEGAATLQDLAKKIESGEIKFADGAQIFFVGCNTASNPLGDSFAETFSTIAFNAYVTGSTDRSSPSPNADKKTDSNNYSSKGNSEWLTYHNGVLVRSKGGSVNPTVNTFK